MPVDVLCGLLLHAGLVLLLAQADGHEGVVGPVLALELQALRPFD